MISLSDGVRLYQADEGRDVFKDISLLKSNGGFHLQHVEGQLRCSEMRWRHCLDWCVAFCSCIPSPLLSPPSPSSVQMKDASWGRLADAWSC